MSLIDLAARTASREELVELLRGTEEQRQRLHAALEKAYRQKPANKAKEREYQRAYMREKRFQCDDAIRTANYYGFAVVAWCVHAYIPTPVEELIYKEDLEEERLAAWPLILRRSSLPNGAYQPRRQPLAWDAGSVAVENAREIPPNNA